MKRSLFVFKRVSRFSITHRKGVILKFTITMLLMVLVVLLFKAHNQQKRYRIIKTWKDSLKESDIKIADEAYFENVLFISPKPFFLPSTLVMNETLRNENMTTHGNASNKTGSIDTNVPNVSHLHKPVLAVILIISKPENVLLRQAARKTWTKDAELYSILIKFVVGRQENWNNIIDRESTMHTDLIIFEDDDDYQSLPTKVMKGFEWVLNSKPSPLYVMKIDDDTIVNLPFLRKQLISKNFISHKQIVGSVVTRRIVNRNIDDPDDHWSVSELDFPPDIYPPYVSGAAYLMTTRTTQILLAAGYLRYQALHLEDVYLTGLIASQSGISRKHEPTFSTHKMERGQLACHFALEKITIAVNNTEQQIFKLYGDVQNLLRFNNKKRCLLPKK